jgi:hypothetical protein
MKLPRTLTLLTTLILMSGCSNEVIAPCSSCDFTGVIEQSTTSADGLVLLVRDLDPASRNDRSFVRVYDHTQIRFVPSGQHGNADADDLAPGRVAYFTIHNVELRSYPRQVSATKIEILE